ncbi:MULTISPECIES: hypothetical protein [Rhodopseudomonas]|uniref:Uncharacterized protein n=1 Tax=Rhodopseudomonas palustris TaxID=1076 RepID=A0A0D7F5U5_RHOPL|nr:MULTISPECIES: hypothetical protein [Rhodopseudomonas]KIZ48156.1 hypothetical protein OO17_00280 [Rhodopseudomonas palustris]MDF3812056.1 hypothetical protein [Rhodopseudomonas sp. BAL398]WOK16084.1 hypothetical protein RBJ75_18165 [Rhodopseudomonas sp. BAL398]
MTQITRLYDDSKNASAALAELKANNFDNAKLASNGKSGSVITVDPPFGKGGQADAILNRHGSSKPLYNGAGHNGSASLLGSSTNISGAPRLTESRTTFGSLGFPELTNPNFFLSTMFGPLLIGSEPFSSLSSSQEPFSSLAANQEGSAKLMDNPAPFSSMLGLPVLSRS